jgi:hypothetical protein
VRFVRLRENGSVVAIVFRPDYIIREQKDWCKSPKSRGSDLCLSSERLVPKITGSSDINWSMSPGKTCQC